LVAIWKANEYEITWIVDGVSHVELHKYDTIPEFKGDTSKESDKIYNYKFIGWDKEVSKVTGKVTYIAQYEKTYIDYEIKFVDDDGSLISSEKYHYGDKVTKPSDPSKDATAQYTYTFSGWDKDVVDVVGEATYKATYSSVVNEYKVTWVVDGVSTEETYKYGEIPSFKGSTSKPADNTYTYEFDDWDKEVSMVTGDVTYTAKYKATYIEYEVKFVDEDGTLISSGKYHYGDKVALPSDPSKAATVQYTYTFSGWDKEVVDVAGEATYKATYSSSINKYTITFVNYDDSVISSQVYDYGSIVTQPNATRSATAQYTYTFSGWDKVVKDVTGNATYKATYSSVVNEYKVTWVVDGVSTEETYKYGETPSFKGNTSKPADNTYTYEFDDWDKEVSMVTGDVTYTAKFNPIYIEYEIKFVDDDDTLISSGKYHYGDKVTLPSDPSKAVTAKYTYTFSGWDKEVVDVVENATYKATYSSVVNEYKVTWVVDGVSTEETYKYGETPSFKVNTSKPADNTYTYEFDDWDKEVSMVTGDVTYTAKYKATYIEYEVKFVDEDGSFISSEKYHYGDKVNASIYPVKDKTAQYTYTFSGWDKEVTVVTGNVTYTATYTASLNMYDVSFVDEYGLTIRKEKICYGDVITEPTEPTKNDHIFLGWYIGEEKYDFNSIIVGELVLTTKWLPITYIKVDDLVNDAYEVIKEQSSIDKFEVEKNNHIISITIVDKTMSSATTLAGTGIATAAENLLNTAGVKEVKIAVDENTYVIVTAENLRQSIAQLDALFKVFAGSDEATAADIIGKSIYISIQTDFGYEPIDDNNFIVNFNYEIDVDNMIEESYLLIKNTVSDEKFEVYKTGNAIKLNIYDKTMDSIVALSGTGIATAAEKLLTKEGVKSVILRVPGTDAFIELTKDNLMGKIGELEALFVYLAGSNTATAEDLIGKSLDVMITLEDGYISSDSNNFTILFAEPDIFQVTFNTNGGSYINPSLVYFERTVDVPNIPTKEGHTFKYWSLNGIEFNFDTLIVSDIELVAVWDVNQYNVVFKNADGSILSNETYYYNDNVIIPKNPTMDSNRIYSYIFKGWDSEISAVKEDVVYTAVYDVIVGIDVLVDDSYDIIKGQASNDKFTVSKDDNTIIVNISDLTMQSVTALSGTGIVTAAENLLSTDGVKSVTIFIPGTDVYVEVTQANLMEKISELDAMFKYLASTENALTVDLVGKGIRVNINLESGYTTNDDSTFAISFVTDFDFDSVVENAYNNTISTVPSSSANITLSDKEITIVVLDTKSSATASLLQSSIIDIIEELLETTGIEEVSLYIPNRNITVNVNLNNLNDKIFEIETLFNYLVGSKDFIAGNLAGNTLELSIKVKDGFVVNKSPEFTIVYDAIYTVDYNVDGNKTSVKVDYNDYLDEPTVPTKVGYTFSHWELNGEKYEFNKPVTSDMELVAVWNINKYEINFISNNNEYGLLNKTSIVVDYGTEITISNNQLIIGEEVVIAIPTIANAQYTYYFKEWSNVPANLLVEGDMTIEALFDNYVNEYKVTWVVNGVSTEETYKYGEIPSFKGSTSKPADNTYTYEFDGWDKEVEKVTGDVTYTAKFNPIYIEYEVKFVDEDGTLISSGKYHYGDKVVVPANPSKDATAQYTYTFSGWDKEVIDVVENATYKATYSSVVNEYKVTWVVDGVSTEESYKYGETPSFKGNTSKAADKTYTYEFAGWDKEVVAVTGEVTYTAKFNPIYIEYEIKFVDDDDTLISSEKYHYGDKVTLPSDPSKDATAQYTYTFSGWDKVVVDVVENATYKATYSSVVNEYKVTWVVDGVSTEETYKYGETPSFKGNTSKPADKTYTYEFAGWDKGVEKVTGDVTYTAKFNPVYIEYEVKWIVDGVTTTENYHFNEMPSFKGSTSKAADKTYTYEFAGWDKEVEAVTGDVTYTAKFNPIYIEYEVKWIVDGVTTTENYHYNETPSFKGSTSKAADKIYTYEFAGWDKEVVVVTGEVTYTAKFNPIYIEYEIKFVDDDDTLISSGKYHYGDKVTLPLDPSKDATAQYTYTFSGWDKDVVDVVENATYKATYSSVVNEYKVTWVVDGVSTEESYKYGETPSFKGNTSKPADNTYTYEFAGWDKGVEKVIGDVTYTAKFNPVYIEYEIKFVDDDDTLISSGKYHYGDKVTLPSNPSKDATAQYTYTFSGWDKEVVEVAGEATYKATYTATVNKYIITFVNYDDSVISSQVYDYGSTITPPTATRAATAQYTYTFSGWDKSVVPVAGEATYKATYTATVNKYTITFVNYDNSVISSQAYDYGSTVTPPTATRAATAQYTYKFAGWDKSVVPVVGEATYKATYTATVNKYTITFVNYDNSVISSQVYDYGSTVTPPIATRPATAQYTYTFSGWDKEVVDVVGEATYKATYSSVVNEYKVTWVVNGVSTDETYKYGEMPSFKGTIPENSLGADCVAVWDPIITSVVGNTTYTLLSDQCGVTVDQNIDEQLSTFSTPKFDVEKNGDNVNVNFTSYDTGSSWFPGDVPHSFSTIFDEVLQIFDLLSNDERYESVTLYTLYPGQAASKAQTIDLKKYDLNDNSVGAWWGSGANDDISNWVGYLATGSLGTMNAYKSDTDDLVGKTVTVTIKLKEDYVNSVDGSDTIVYNLTFSSD